MRSKERSECLKKARVERGLYQCALCPEGHLSRAKDIEVDHIIPTVPLTGWDGFDGFIKRLWCSVDDLRCVCKTHNKEVTDAQRIVRKELRVKK